MTLTNRSATLPNICETRYLLDTHVVLWYFNGDSQLPEHFKAILDDENSTKFVSKVSLWEVAIKISRGKLFFGGNTAGMLRRILVHRFELLDISEEHIIQVETLPFLHSDPFDRLLIAAAQIEKLRLLTADSKILQYALP